MAAWLVTALEIGLWLLLAAGSLHLLRAAFWGLAAGPLRRPATSPAPADAPLVTVQLPLRNERHVAERVMRAACALSWPRLEVQVLDDSDDETVALVDATAAELRAAGHAIEVVRRQGRHGYKAGALQHALGRARGEFLLILDADCVPPEDLLEQLMPALLADETLAFAQARWSFANERAGLLTRAQAIILHALFTIEQARLTAQKKPLQFNGTSGVFRRRALEAAGGWLGARAGASVTEDLDLSYRVQLAGSHGATFPEIAVETELPQGMRAFRAQQTRWVRGGGEVLRVLARRLLRGEGRPGERATMLGHLLRHARQPYLLLLVAGFPAVALAELPRHTPAWGWPAAIALTYAAVSLYYAATLRRLGRSPLGGLWLAPLVLALSLGLCLTFTVALVQGLLAGPGGEFVRTPKLGDAKKPAYRARGSLLSLVELALGALWSLLVVRAALAGAWPAAAVWAALPAFGLLWVGLGSSVD